MERSERRGRAAVAILTGIVAVTWIPQLAEPFGDNHLGRIIGRYALHLRNLQEHGILGSHFGADWAPYAATPYAHHPPLLNLLTALTGLLPGDGEYQVWLPPYLLALLIVPAAAALLRAIGLRWSATLLAVGLMVATTFYWVFSPLMFDLGPILALSATVVRLRARPEPSRRLVLAACASALLCTLVSWPGVGLAAILGLWLFAARRFDRVTILVGTSMLLGVAISLAYVVGVTGMALLGGQAELRSSGGGHTLRQILRRQWFFVSGLLPVWYLGALPLGTVAGLLDRRSRSYLAIAAGFTAVWIFGLRNAAYVHSYWSYPLLVVGLVGMGVLLDRVMDGIAPPPAPHSKLLSDRLVSRGEDRGEDRGEGRRRVGVATAVLVGAALATYLGVLVAGPDRHRLLSEPAQAGRLVAGHPPPPGQRYAWVAGDGASSPRWLAYYWNLPPRLLTAATLTSEPTRPEDLVLVDLRRPPEWLSGPVEAGAVARAGPYVLVPVSVLGGGPTGS
ncbi:ArnT family glycosyltransferase [Plantactinospora sp. WMMB334]|uniref:ArnT family glycosyltransferase n=1 Tax=Plantactinospora sp. WMMB334 TaxID=3404119 RepID=UPI003B94C135